MKKIWIEYFLVSKGIAGVGMYSERLVAILDKMDEVKYKTFTCEWIENQNKFIRAILFFLWLNTVFYIKTWIEKPDIIIFPKQIMSYFKVPGVKYLTILHDMSTVANHVKRAPLSVMRLNFFNWVAKKRADRVATISDFSRKEIQEYLGIQNMDLIYNSISDIIKESNNEDVLSAYNLEDKKYILAIGTQNAHKNIISLVRAFNIISPKYPDLKLALIGKKGNDKEIYENLNEKIIITGYVDEKMIPNLYKHALMYLFPSKYEGFGIPIIEAQYTGTPLICSDIEVFHEVAGEGAEFCGFSPEEIAEKIEYLINNPQRREDIVKIGLENVKRFSDDVIIKQVRDFIAD